MQHHEILQILSSLGAVITGSHIVYTSGKHGSAYVNKDAIYPYPDLTSQLCLQLATHFQNKNIQTVIAPVIGGVILSQWTAYHLSKISGKSVFAVYAEKSANSEEFVIGRGYDRHIRGKRVLVVEDVLNTGGSVKKVVEATKKLEGEIVGVGALCNRGSVTPENLGGVPELVSLLNIELDAWDEENCPLCERKVPINTRVGKGSQFLARRSHA